ncbi:hypothetical protein SAY86_014179 [Trapa natans]|uniref:GATA transcription factor n=1 Tax=Trapa natans TaxID=22666 RepID=A0AAN7KTP7_TRANT|nr:hypothetical protein SAY86_014179 [Trapa natans]
MEFFGVSVQSCDDFSVDDLLNFANDDVLVAGKDEEESHERKQNGQDSGGSSVSGEIGELLHQVKSSMEITFFLEDDDLANLEWLSQFVDDSYDLPESSPANHTGQPHVSHSEPVEGTPVKKFCFNTPVPGKARSRRSRTGGRVCSILRCPFSSTPSPSGSSARQSLEPDRSGTARPVKRHNNRRHRTEPWSGPAGHPVRRCSHCGVQKTPQWRAGPMGEKTLCNACGVRFKSGRLLPEYRPAGSPTFCSKLHSNHHRKLLEMRQKKELLGRHDSA